MPFTKLFSFDNMFCPTSGVAWLGGKNVDGSLWWPRGHPGLCSRSRGHLGCGDGHPSWKGGV